MKYSISIPLNGEALLLARESQKILSEFLSIDSILKNNSLPHINLVSGTTRNIDQIFSIIKKLTFNRKKCTELFGLGVFLTPNPLLYLRFKNSPFVEELRFALIDETISLWESIDYSVSNDIWIPKSTIAYSDLSLINLSDALISLKHINFKLKMEITELSIIEFTNKECEVGKILL